MNVEAKAKWVLFLLAAMVYLPSLGYSFVYDDWWFIVKNPALDHIFPLGRFFSDALTSAAPASGIPMDVYRPLSTLTFAINKVLCGLTPACFRVVNLILHFMNGTLLWVFLSKRSQWWGAFLGTGLFLLHPVQVESVVWISQRSILMCATGCLGTLVLWDRFLKNPNKGTFYYMGALLCYLIALFSKETALGLPVILYFIGRNTNSSRQGMKIVPLFALGFIYMVIRRQVLGHWAQPVNRSESWFVSMGDGLVALAHYAQSLLWPVSLNVSVQAPESLGFGTMGLWFGGVIFLLLLMPVLGQSKKWYSKSLISIIFLVFWAPHSGFVPLVTFAADRFLYLPMIGVALGFSLLGKHSTLKWLGCLVLLILAGLTFSRSKDWRSDEMLWLASVQEDPQNAFAWASYAGALQQQGRWGQAQEAYVTALRNRPTVPLARSVLKILIDQSLKRGDFELACQWEEKLKTVPK
ncbi:MAG: hypothetical protein KCHDKBKB_01859 [Elusimicrobia bacterium]|nr:hypothetical protein [Elusimicrobiota bacterium]